MWIRKEQLNYESDCGTREINGSFACECHRKLVGTRGEAKLRNLHVRAVLRGLENTPQHG